MEIGLHLPSAQPGATAEGILEIALLAEELGFDAVWAFDHLLTPTSLASQYPYARAYPIGPSDPIFDPLALFGVLAGKTARLKLGTGVLIAAYRHPIVLAKILASIERFAPGRLVLGVGAGWMREEFDALGVPFERPGARLEELVAALRAVWSDGPSRFDGERYRWPEAGFAPAPTRPIPILIGGHSDVALRRAARVGDGWAIALGKGQGAGVDAITARLEALRAMRREEGTIDRPFELLCQNTLAFSDTGSPKLPFVGPAHFIAENLRRLRDAGVTMVDLAAYGPREAIAEAARRFVDEVRPLL